MDRNRKILIVVILASIIVGLGLTIPFGMLTTDINDLGTVTVKASGSVITGHTITSGEYLFLTDWDTIVVEHNCPSRNEKFTATLYCIDEGKSKATGVWSRVGSISYWLFSDLSAAPYGNNKFRIDFSGGYVDSAGTEWEVTGSSYSFNLINDQLPTYDPPESVEITAPATATVGEIITLSWTFTYIGPCTYEVYFDSVMVYEGVGSESSIPQEGSITVTAPDEPGTSHAQLIVFYEGTSKGSEQPDILVTEVPTIPTTTNTTTTTTTTPTTTTTTTTTTIDDEDGPLVIPIMVAIGTVSMILVTIILWRKR